MSYFEALKVDFFPSDVIICHFYVKLCDYYDVSGSQISSKSAKLCHLTLDYDGYVTLRCLISLVVERGDIYIDRDSI